MTQNEEHPVPTQPSFEPKPAKVEQDKPLANVTAAADAKNVDSVVEVPGDTPTPPSQVVDVALEDSSSETQSTTTTTTTIDSAVAKERMESAPENQQLTAEPEGPIVASQNEVVTPAAEATHGDASLLGQAEAENTTASNSRESIKEKALLDTTPGPVQRTLALIKPDAVMANTVDAIIEKITEAGFSVVQDNVLHLTKDQACLFYREHENKPFYGELTVWMSSGPIHALVLEKTNAIRDWRALMGPTDPSKARELEPNSIRALFGTDGMNNATHGSDCQTSADREIDIIFNVFVKESDTTAIITADFETLSAKQPEQQTGLPITIKESVVVTGSKVDELVTATTISETIVIESNDEQQEQQITTAGEVISQGTLENADNETEQDVKVEEEKVPVVAVETSKQLPVAISSEPSPLVTEVKIESAQQPKETATGAVVTTTTEFLDETPAEEAKEVVEAEQVKIIASIENQDIAKDTEEKAETMIEAPVQQPFEIVKESTETKIVVTKDTVAEVAETTTSVEATEQQQAAEAEVTETIETTISNTTFVSKEETVNEVKETMSVKDQLFMVSAPTEEVATAAFQQKDAPSEAVDDVDVVSAVKTTTVVTVTEIPECQQSADTAVEVTLEQTLTETETSEHVPENPSVAQEEASETTKLASEAPEIAVLETIQEANAAQAATEILTEAANPPDKVLQDEETSIDGTTEDPITVENTIGQEIVTKFVKEIDDKSTTIESKEDSDMVEKPEEPVVVPTPKVEALIPEQPVKETEEVLKTEATVLEKSVEEAEAETSIPENLVGESEEASKTEATVLEKSVEEAETVASTSENPVGETEEAPKTEAIVLDKSVEEAEAEISIPENPMVETEEAPKVEAAALEKHATPVAKVEVKVAGQSKPSGVFKLMAMFEADGPKTEKPPPPVKKIVKEFPPKKTLDAAPLKESVTPVVEIQSTVAKHTSAEKKEDEEEIPLATVAAGTEIVASTPDKVSEVESKEEQPDAPAVTKPVSVPAEEVTTTAPAEEEPGVAVASEAEKEEEHVTKEEVQEPESESAHSEKSSTNTTASGTSGDKSSSGTSTKDSGKPKSSTRSPLRSTAGATTSKPKPKPKEEQPPKKPATGVPRRTLKAPTVATTTAIAATTKAPMTRAVHTTRRTSPTATTTEDSAATPPKRTTGTTRVPRVATLAQKKAAPKKEEEEEEDAIANAASSQPKRASRTSVFSRLSATSTARSRHHGDGADATTATTATPKPARPSGAVKKKTTTTNVTTTATAINSPPRRVSPSNTAVKATTEHKAVVTKRTTGATASHATSSATGTRPSAKKTTSGSDANPVTKRVVRRVAAGTKKTTETTGDETKHTMKSKKASTAPAAAEKKENSDHKEEKQCDNKEKCVAEKHDDMPMHEEEEQHVLKERNSEEEQHVEVKIEKEQTEEEEEHVTKTEVTVEYIVESVLEESSHDHDEEVASVAVQLSEPPATPPSDGKESAASAVSSRTKTPEIASLRNKFEASLSANISTSLNNTTARSRSPNSNHIKDMINRFAN